MFAGKMLKDEHTVGYYKIQKGDTSFCHCACAVAGKRRSARGRPLDVASVADTRVSVAETCVSVADTGVTRHSWRAASIRTSHARSFG